MSNFLHISDSNLSKLKRDSGWLKGRWKWDSISVDSYDTALAVCREGDYLRVNTVAIKPIKNYTDFSLHIIREGGGVNETPINREDVIAILPSKNIL